VAPCGCLAAKIRPLLPVGLIASYDQFILYL